MKKSFLKKLSSIRRGIKTHIMLKKEVYTVLSFCLFIAFSVIGAIAAYNYSVVLESRDFYKQRQTIDYKTLVEELKNGNITGYSKSQVYSQKLDFSKVWFDTKKATLLDSYSFVHKNSKEYLYTEDMLRAGSLLKKEDKDLVSALYNLKSVEGINYSFINFSIRSVVDGMFWALGIVFLMFAAQFLIAEVIAGKNFTQKNMDTNLDFDDIVGYEDVKKEFLDIANYIKNKSDYTKNSLTVPRGILLTGDPGVGKTLFAKAFASHVNATLYVASGSDFAELYVGVGAKRIRSLFRSASMSSPSVIFIDEFDAIGNRASMGQDSERLSVINQLLTEMDGLNKKSDIFVIATTNYEEKIDSALLRPGRIDKKINIPLPDNGTRRGIIEKYLGDFKMSEALLDAMAIRTQSMSAASIKNIIEQAKTLHVKEFGLEIKNLSKETIMTAQENILMGFKQNLSLKPQQEKTICYHELGHAIACVTLLPDKIVEKVSIEPRGKSLGQTFMSASEENFLYTKDQVLNHICVLLAGRASEEVFMGCVTNGAADDLQKANTLAHDLLFKFGMGSEHNLVVDIFPSNPVKPDAWAQERQRVLQQEYDRAKEIVKTYQSQLLEVSKILLDKKTIDGSLVSAIVQHSPPSTTKS